MMINNRFIMIEMNHKSSFEIQQLDDNNEKDKIDDNH